jgi:hypothetical protein
MVRDGFAWRNVQYDSHANSRPLKKTPANIVEDCGLIRTLSRRGNGVRRSDLNLDQKQLHWPNSGCHFLWVL